MKPEISNGAVLEGKPSLTRVKRLTRFALEAIRVFPKSSEKIEAEKSDEIANEKALERRGRSFLHTLRSTFGGSLQEGIVLRPTNDNPHVITVKVAAQDTNVYRSTVAHMGIESKGGHMTHLMIGTAEPTRGAKRMLPTPPDFRHQDWINVIDRNGADRLYSLSDYGKAERDELAALTLRAMDEVTTACDQGECEVFAMVS